MIRSLVEPPPATARARFAPDFGQRVLLTVDTEEEFDWNGPFTRDRHGLTHAARFPEFQHFCDGIGVVPHYLVDWPIASSPVAMDVLVPAAREGRAEIGIQLHPWVNPPFEEETNARNSYAGNLPFELERAKLLALRDLIEDRSGIVPLTYRAGRYGLGARTHEILREAGVAIDTSVRANFDYRAGHGPDYSAHPIEPYWIDDEQSLLELPVTTVFWGMLRRQGRWIHPLAERLPRMRGALARVGLLERIALTPEGITLDEAIRGIDIAIDDGLPVIVLSLHSPSIAPGHTPYVRSEDDVERLYERLDGVYDYMRRRGIKSTSVAEIMRSVVRGR